MTPRNTLPVAIAGGGIGGLACALALGRRGFRVIVLEQASAFGEAGVGLQVAPNALAVLEALGVGNDAKRNALMIERAVMMDGVSGETIIDIPTGTRFRERFGNPYAVAHRADIHGALLRACQTLDAVELRTDSRVVDFEHRERGASVKLASGDVVEATALIGADGIRSQVRQKIVGDGEPSSAGALIYRALIPAAQMPADEQKPYPTMWMGPGTHAIYYPVRDWTVFNFAVTVVTPDSVAKGEGEATREEALNAFADGHAIPRGIMKIPQRFNRYVIRHRSPVDNWTREAVTLLGDAAHPMVQYLAQGAAMALEDAICLAVMADEGNGDFPAAFQRYQDIRIVRTARVQLSSMMLDKIYHVGGIERLVRNSIFQGRSAEEYYDRLSWLYESPPYVRRQFAKTEFPMSIQLYDLAGAELNRRFSPYCWRIKLALAHKRLAYDTVPWRFTEKERIAFSGQGRVPVLIDDGRVVSDSWSIATYLEDTYPDRPSLFRGDAARSVTRFLNAWADGVLVGGIARLTVTDILAHVDAKDRDYFRTSREQRFGASLETVVAERDTDVLAFRNSLAPMRTVLAAQPYLGGDEPAYADYIVFGCFQWARCISPFPLLLKTDPVWTWRAKLLTAFDGLAGKAKAYAEDGDREGI